MNWLCDGDHVVFDLTIPSAMSVWHRDTTTGYMNTKAYLDEFIDTISSRGRTYETELSHWYEFVLVDARQLEGGGVHIESRLCTRENTRPVKKMSTAAFKIEDVRKHVEALCQYDYTGDLPEVEAYGNEQDMRSIGEALAKVRLKNFAHIRNEDHFRRVRAERIAERAVRSWKKILENPYDPRGEKFLRREFEEFARMNKL